MGSAKLYLTSLELNRAEDLTIKLEDAQRASKDLGELKLSVTLWPKTQEDKEQVRTHSIPRTSSHTLSHSVSRQPKRFCSILSYLLIWSTLFTVFLLFGFLL